MTGHKKGEMQSRSQRQLCKVTVRWRAGSWSAHFICAPGSYVTSVDQMGQL